VYLLIYLITADKNITVLVAWSYQCNGCPQYWPTDVTCDTVSVCHILHQLVKCCL